MTINFSEREKLLVYVKTQEERRAYCQFRMLDPNLSNSEEDRLNDLIIECEENIANAYAKLQALNN